MYEYERIYRKLLEDDELSSNFTGDWELDKASFILMQESNEDVVLDLDDDYDDDYFFEDEYYGDY